MYQSNDKRSSCTLQDYNREDPIHNGIVKIWQELGNSSDSKFRP